MTLLALEHVQKTYYRGGRHRLPILRDVNLHVGAGEIVAVVADPAAGKTTLLRIAAGLEPPDSGSVQLGGRPLPATNDPDPRLALVTRTPPPRETMAMRMLELVAIPLLEEMTIAQASARRITAAAATVSRSCATSACASMPERSSRSSPTRPPARPPCCASPRGSNRPTPAPSISPASCFRLRMTSTHASRS